MAKSKRIITSTEEAAISSEWESLKQYLSMMESYLESTREKFIDWVKEQEDKLPPQQRHGFNDEYIEDIVNYYEEFPRILRNSFLVSAHSVLEYDIDIICKKLKEMQEIPINISDLHGNILKRAKLYWSLAKLHFPCDEKTWQEINNYSQVRNCIAHDNGLLQEDDKNLIIYVKKKGIISNSTDERRIVLTKQFCEEALQTMQNFVITLYESLQHK